MTFGIPFSRFSGEEFWVIRYMKPSNIDGVFSYDEPEVLRFPGQIQVISTKQNIKTNIGEDITQKVYITTPQNYPLFIETKVRENDVVFYRNDFWQVESSVQYDKLISHNEAHANLIVQPGEELTRLAPYYLQVNDDGDILVDGNCDRMVFGLSDF